MYTHTKPVSSVPVDGRADPVDLRAARNPRCARSRDCRRRLEVRVRAFFNIQFSDFLFLFNHNMNFI